MAKEMRMYVVQRMVSSAWMRPTPIEAVDENAAAHVIAHRDEKTAVSFGRATWRRGDPFFYRSRLFASHEDWKVFRVTAKYEPEFTIAETIEVGGMTDDD